MKNFLLILGFFCLTTNNLLTDSYKIDGVETEKEAVESMIEQQFYVAINNFRQNKNLPNIQVNNWISSVIKKQVTEIAKFDIETLAIDASLRKHALQKDKDLRAKEYDKIRLNNGQKPNLWIEVAGVAFTPLFDNNHNLLISKTVEGFVKNIADNDEYNYILKNNNSRNSAVGVSVYLDCDKIIIVANFLGIENDTTTQK